MTRLLIALALVGGPAVETTWVGLMLIPGGSAEARCAEVIAVAPSGPTDGKIGKGDCIRSVDGVAVYDADSFSVATRNKLTGKPVLIETQFRLVEVKIASRPNNAFELLCADRKRGPPHVRLSFDGKNVEVLFPERATVGDARAAIGAPPATRALINPRSQCDHTVTPLMVDASDATLLENNDSVVFVPETRDAGVRR